MAHEISHSSSSLALPCKFRPVLSDLGIIAEQVVIMEGSHGDGSQALRAGEDIGEGISSVGGVGASPKVHHLLLPDIDTQLGTLLPPRVKVLLEHLLEGLIARSHAPLHPHAPGVAQTHPLEAVIAGRKSGGGCLAVSPM